MTFTYNLTLVKGGEVTIEHLIGPSQYDDEIDECGYDVRDAHFYLQGEDGEEMVIETDNYEDLPQIEPVETLNDDQYVKYMCWRTSEWTIKSPTPLTAADVILVRKEFGGESFVDWDIEVEGVESEFDSSWDGKYCEIIVEARNPQYVAEDLD